MADTAQAVNPAGWMIYFDDDVIVINKPSGILSLPDGYDPDLPHLSSILEPSFGKIWMVHRLDKDTSGLLVLARNTDAHRELNRQFRERLVHKTYHCLVCPHPEWQELVMDEPLRVDADRAHRTRVDLLKGKPARTEAVVLKRKQQVALIACKISTGYRHQIRAHLYFHNLTILGDTLYQHKNVCSEKQMDAPRLMLHASELQFLHPRSLERLDFSIPDPIEFEEWLCAD